MAGVRGHVNTSGGVVPFPGSQIVLPSSAPSDPPAFACHEIKVARWLRGTGVEIGAFKKPVPGIRPFYVDRFATYVDEPTCAEYEGDATSLPFKDHSLDYIVASHVLEHLANPVRAFREWTRVLRHRGIIYLVVPDRRFTWDHNRAPTSVDHMLEDDIRGTTDIDATHIDDFARGIDWTMFAPQVPAGQIPQERETLRRTLHGLVRSGSPINIHFHVFEPANLIELIQALQHDPERGFDGRILDWQERFPASCPNGIWMAIEVRQPWASRLSGWRHRRLTRTNPRHPLLATAKQFNSNNQTEPVPASASNDPTELTRQLDDVVRREASFRLKTIQTFRELDQRLREEKSRADRLSEELGDRNGYIHELHQKQIATREEFAAINEDLAVYSQRLATAEDEAAALRAKLERVTTSWAWRYGGVLRALQRLFGASTLRTSATPVPPAAMDASLVYYLHTSPFRIFRTRTFTLRGWVYGRNPGPITAVRARIGALEFIGRHGLPEPETVAVHQLAGGPHERPGFEIPLTFESGRQTLVLEAQTDHREWRAFLVTPVWVEQRMNTDGHE